MTAAVDVAQMGTNNTTFRNRIINGNFDIWQRGTSFSNPSGDTYTADRFLVVPGGGTTGDTVSQQTFTPGQTDVPGEPTYFLRFAVGATSANRVMHHRIEDVRTFAGQTCTLSFYAKASTAHTSTVEFSQNFGSGGSTAVNLSAIAYTMSTSWQKFTFTITLPSIAGKTIGTSSYLYIAFIRSLGASSVNIDIAQMQFEKGPQATAFDVRPFDTELRLCQRYYYRLNPSSTGTGLISTGWAVSTTSTAFSIPYPVQMRVQPTALEQSGTAAHYQIVYQASAAACSGVPTFGAETTVDRTRLEATVASGLTAGNGVGIRYASTSAYLAWSAEL